MSRSDFDEHAATELRLYIDNDYNLHRQMREPIEKNLKRKKAKGKYDPKLAVKAFQYLADAGAKKYHKEFGGGGKWHDTFSKTTRTAVASSFVKELGRK